MTGTMPSSTHRAMPVRADRRQALLRSARVLALATYPIAAMSTLPATAKAAAQAAAQAAATMPAELLAALPGSRLVGTGVLRFFGLKVYEARLWAPAGFVPLNYGQQPFALELVYERKLEGAAIAERSIAEMRRVGPFGEDQGQRWLALMKQAFPDVVAQDRLLGLNDGQGGVRFFYNGQPTVQIQDADYARLFFGIWLAQQTSAPALRNALLGLKD